MNNGFDVFSESGEQSLKDTVDLVGRLFDVAQPSSVFAEPVSAEGYTVITASEVMTGMGFGSGYGVGFGQDDDEESPADDNGHAPDELPMDDEPAMSGGAGGGGGGGGFSAGRPVAVISIGPNGVVAQPVVDITKLGIAFITMLGSLLVMLSRMRQVAKG
jgi:uncharacterized spore protein YtfJ